jgi:leucine-rich repeat protein SHOC2
MERAELKQIMNKFKINLKSGLSLDILGLTRLPDDIINTTHSIELDLSLNQLNIIRKNIRSPSSAISLFLAGSQLESLTDDIVNLSNLNVLGLSYNKLISLPDDIGKLSNLTILHLGHNQLTNLPDDIGNLTSLCHLDLRNNQLTSLPKSFSNLTSLLELYLDDNQLTSIPEEFDNLSNLEYLSLGNNPLVDLSILQNLRNLKSVNFHRADLPHRYWTKFNEWKPGWLLDEHNTEIRRILIEQVGYEKICNELGAIELDIWREYTLLIVDDVETSEYDEDGYYFEAEPMVLLKMTCPSTGHIHILRVPPEMTSAEAAITWINHGIHPDEFARQT